MVALFVPRFPVLWVLNHLKQNATFPPRVWKTRHFVIKCSEATAKTPYQRGDIMEGKVQLEITYCVP